mmetsp:Transcript_139609/g.260284  ORF Transcript_139609/g.260284 Transcript_139609/m.260284 type:complete len:272 (+) Transcript_139609:312-1127(+)
MVGPMPQLISPRHCHLQSHSHRRYRSLRVATTVVQLTPLPGQAQAVQLPHLLELAARPQQHPLRPCHPALPILLYHAIHSQLVVRLQLPPSPRMQQRRMSPQRLHQRKHLQLELPALEENRKKRRICPLGRTHGRNCGRPGKLAPVCSRPGKLRLLILRRHLQGYLPPCSLWLPPCAQSPRQELLHLHPRLAPPSAWGLPAEGPQVHPQSPQARDIPSTLLLQLVRWPLPRQALPRMQPGQRKPPQVRCQRHLHPRRNQPHLLGPQVLQHS